MDKEKYLNTQQQILNFAALIKDLPLLEFIEEIDRGTDLRLILNPALWMRDHSKMRKIRKMAYHLLQFQQWADD